MPLIGTFFRLKKINTEKTELKKCLNLFSLSLLGIGSTLGLGVYVLIGTIAAKTGPSILISFIIAAFASFFSGLCYAEFGALVPKAGSAYIYSYVTVGELVAFIIGWNLVLEYAIGTSSVAKGYSLYLDSLFGNHMVNFFKEYLPIYLGPRFSDYFDLLSFSITILLTILLCFGVKGSVNFNTVLTCLNILIITFSIITGFFKVDFHNWNLSPAEVGPLGGNGGFMPFGFFSILSGSATCFFLFVGFDCICTSSEETKNPSKTIPLSIILCLIVVTIAYIFISSIQTLMWPYYDAKFLPEIFHLRHFEFAKWIIAIGTLFGISSSLLGSIFPLPRILYSMASDGLIYRFLCKVNKKRKVPINATIISGILAGLISSIFDLDALTDMMSIGTLLAYTLVSISVLIIRYKKKDTDDSIPLSNEFSLYDYMYLYSFNNLLNLEKSLSPTLKTSSISSKLIIIICFLMTLFLSSIIFQSNYLVTYNLYAWMNVVILGIVTLFFCICLSLQPKNSKNLLFEVPFVPFIPLTSIFFNILLILNLSNQTWIRFSVWMIIGFFIYFTYGIKNSTGYMTEREKLDFLKTE